MALQLFGNKQFGGNSTTITSNTRDLQTTSLNYRASSAKLTASSDRVLFFDDTLFRGEVMFRRGPIEIMNLGKGGTPSSPIVTASGQIHLGKDGFNNNVRSVRLTPFDLNIKYHYVHNGLNLPGTHDEDHGAFLGLFSNMAKINELHNLVVPIYDRFMLNLVKNPTVGQIDRPSYFSMTRGGTINPDEADRFRSDDTIGLMRSAINVVFVDQLSGIASNSTVSPLRGLAPLYSFEPEFYLVLFVEMKPDAQTNLMARTIGHELGHLLGLPHFADPATADPRNLMTITNLIGSTPPLSSVLMENTQIETMHDRLARFNGVDPSFFGDMRLIRGE